MRTPFFRPRQKPKKLPIMFRGSTQMENEILLVNHAYFDNIVNGRGDVEMYLTIVFRTLAGLQMAEPMDQKEEIQVIIKKALGSLWFVGERILKKHKVGFSGNEMIAIKEALVLIDELHKATTRLDHRNIYADVAFKVGGMTLTMQSLEPFKDSV
ncbi:hypothetical protein Axy10_039 [Achromobacter phage vB_AxyP_19-32_Axy10]|uniref:Uncharacterized protein n=1 Tax=Achromobacter phage vB_AxyP_19-32_Axy10 TaxID=2591041 RepID=A0A514CU03_9CAUD|nr:hypothetical protein KMC59_gp79 [Achromobacter phage vB_AxyP_19-32_Axy10]QDH83952.1 hypothetical protein Axy10_039 [Achromobacter phage vB_AxyP_19-32_Axy10]